MEKNERVSVLSEVQLCVCLSLVAAMCTVQAWVCYGRILSAAALLAVQMTSFVKRAFKLLFVFLSTVGFFFSLPLPTKVLFQQQLCA